MPRIRKRIIAARQAHKRAVDPDGLTIDLLCHKAEKTARAIMILCTRGYAEDGLTFRGYHPSKQRPTTRTGSGSGPPAGSFRATRTPGSREFLEAPGVRCDSGALDRRGHNQEGDHHEEHGPRGAEGLRTPNEVVFIRYTR
jgi:hypothetical protein